VAEVAEEPMVVSKMFEVPPLMNTFSQQRIHVAIVVNEFGSISGMVTREDAIEEVLGEVNDEFDVEPDPITITGSLASVRGDVLLEVLNERFGLALPGDQVDTVSGYVWHHLARQPAVGDTVPLLTEANIAGVEGTGDSDLPRPHSALRVDSVDGTLVDRVSFTLPTDDPGEYPT
jgi:CBS domain containing-hemolysin-like protein